MNNRTTLIIGAGAMGSAIALGLARAGRPVCVCNRSEGRLAKFAGIEHISTTTDLHEALAAAPALIILALPFEPLKATLPRLRDFAPDSAAIASLSPFTSLEMLAEVLPGRPVLRIMPNIGITRGESMTFVCAPDSAASTASEVVSLFRSMGDAALIPESEMGAVTALASCGIAYALRYIRASMQAGVTMGLEPADACRYTLQTLRGACALLADGHTHPEAEIDKVCTPGGLTVKGVDTLDFEGFSAALIKAVLASYKP